MSDIEPEIEMWRQRANGQPVACRGRCKRPGLALSVGIAGTKYQWSCVTCFWTSAWFTVIQGNVRTFARARVLIETPRSMALPKGTP